MAVRGLGRSSTILEPVARLVEIAALTRLGPDQLTTSVPLFEFPERFAREAGLRNTGTGEQKEGEQ